MGQVEEIQALSIDNTRRFLGIMLFVINVPIMLQKSYEMYTRYRAGYEWSTGELLGDLAIMVVNLVLVIYLPRILPLYPSRYALTEEGVKMTRFMRPNTLAHYKYLIRAELYIPKKGRDEANKNLQHLARTQLNEMRNSGFKQEDFTNDMQNVVLLISGDSIFALSPLYPKAFLDKLRKMKPGLPAKQIEARNSGRRESEI